MAKNYPPFVNAVEKTDHELYEAVTRVSDLAMGPGELEPKVKVLIAMALDAFASSPEGVKSLSKAARNLGATEGEIAETLRIAYQVAGMKTLAASRSAYED